MSKIFFDSHQIRLTQVQEDSSKKKHQWLFIPGGPGADSCYLKSLSDLLKLPGSVFLVDFPGNGDNTQNLPSNYSYDNWLKIFHPFVKEFENPVIVGHSGAMLPLLFREMEDLLKGFVILNSAPSLWLQKAVEETSA